MTGHKGWCWSIEKLGRITNINWNGTERYNIILHQFS